MFLSFQEPTLFIAPFFLFLPRRGDIVPLTLDLERLAPSLANGRFNFSFLLRRRQNPSRNGGSGRNVALRRFAVIGALPRFEQRLRWINHVAAAYARATGTIALWDLHTSNALIHECALLPPGSEFLLEQHDDELFYSFRRSTQQRKFPSTAVLFQKDILESILLPMARKVLREGRSMGPEKAEPMLRRVAEIGVSFMGSISREGCIVCPALECFVFAALWRLGSGQEIFAMLRSLSQTNLEGKITKRGNKARGNVMDNGTIQTTRVILLIMELVQFGSRGREETTIRNGSSRKRKCKFFFFILKIIRRYLGHTAYPVHELLRYYR
jgi:hypothetical protein